MLTEAVLLFALKCVLPQSLYDDEELWNRIYFDESVGCQTARDSAVRNVLVDTEDHDRGLYFVVGTVPVAVQTEPRYWCVGRAGCDCGRPQRELT